MIDNLVLTACRPPLTRFQRSRMHRHLTSVLVAVRAVKDFTHISWGENQCGLPSLQTTFYLLQVYERNYTFYEVAWKYVSFVKFEHNLNRKRRLKSYNNHNYKNTSAFLTNKLISYQSRPVTVNKSQLLQQGCTPFIVILFYRSFIYNVIRRSRRSVSDKAIYTLQGLSKEWGIWPEKHHLHEEWEIVAKTWDELTPGLPWLHLLTSSFLALRTLPLVHLKHLPLNLC